MLAEIAVCLPLSRTFVYELAEPAEIGCRVRVRFRSSEVEGFIVGFPASPPPGVEIQKVGELLDRSSLLRPDVLDLCRWIADYYLAPPGEVLKSALPPGITNKHLARFDPGPDVPHEKPAAPFKLTTEQLTALYAIEKAEGFSTLLLHGVTGSGKTEIYIQAADIALSRGNSCLILVPEIGLTPQLTERFAARFPGRVAVLHSSLTRKQRIEEWLRILHGRAPVVVGTRSAVFAPLRNLKLIIVDEEHETTYKQEETPRYHARDTAIVRAQRLGATVVLGSATPSMESFRNAERKKFEYVHLTGRVEDRPLPDVEVVNMREEYAAEGKKIFSRRLLQAIGERLERREQTMVLLNRRGFAAYLLCRHCGFTFQCTSCSVSMTYHKSVDRLLCHYCGLAKRPPALCPECKSEYIYYVGEGTERIEAELRELFADARIGRIDRDTMKHVRDFERVLGGFRKGELDILVGTQMIAKGHDFPLVTLVGVLAADAALSLPDFRAAERTFQLLTQVAGRSGRGDRPGEVIIQSFYPDHYTFQLACTQKFEEFYARESRYRKAMFYPPFTALAGIVVTDRDKDRAARESRAVSEFLDSVRGDSVRILGPAPAPLERVKRLHRYQLLIKAGSRSTLHALLVSLREHLDARKLGGTRVLVDVDPMSLL
jgi:primosomal protein N' (replication factor Y)